MSIRDVIYGVCLFLLFCSAARAEYVLRVGWEPYPPNQWKDEAGLMRGLDIEVLEAVLKEAGYSAEYIKMPWQRILRSGLKNGDVDIALHAGYFPEREEFAYYSAIPYFPADSSIFIRAEDKEKYSQIKTLQDAFKNKLKIGAQIGAKYSREYEQLIKNPEFASKLYLSAKEDQIIGMLLAGRTDVMIGGYLGTGAAIKRWQVEDKIAFHSFISRDQDITGSFFLLSKASVDKELLAGFNEALKTIKRNGTIDRIVGKYLTSLE